MSTYKASIPKTNDLDPRIPSFFEKFYSVSDDPSEAAHREYVAALTDDGTLIMGTKVAKGRDEIMSLRRGLWSGPVKTRLHTLKQIYSFDKGSDQVMVHGHVDYGLKNGKEVTVEWAGRATMVEEGGELKMKFYQVYLDSAVVADALK